jgi:phosphoribosylaminoimidazole carboxylase (NCAIR synthetase)
MTPSARARLERAGAAPVPTPSFEVIRKVNHRAFSAGLGQGLPGGTFVRSVADVESAMRRIDAPLGVLLKRPFGFAGRGQRRVRDVLSDADRAWLLATPIAEGVQVEPRVAIIVEHSVHGVIGEDGSVTLGPVVVQVCDAAGAWQETRTTTPADLDAEEAALMLRETRRVGEALFGATYFGPFGVDGFVYLDAEGRRRLCVRSEINARYTMGWALG